MFGGVLSDFGARILGVDDPRDQEALSLIEEIIHQGQSSGASGAGDGSGFQLRDLTPYLKTYRFHQEHPWAIPLGLAVAVGGLVYLGYKLR